jgi:hypothetical protein
MMIATCGIPPFIPEPGEALFNFCNDPVEFCSGAMVRRETREYDDGRGCEELDARRKSALVLDIIQGRTMVSEAARQSGPAP